MATRADVRRIALSLPQTIEGEDHFAFSVGGKGIAWLWMERVAPKKPRVPNPEVLAVRVDGHDVKEMLLSSDSKKFFTEPHYSGFPAILVRLPAIGVAEIAELLTGAWRCQAPRALVAAFDQGSGGKAPAPRRVGRTARGPARSKASGKPRR